MQCHAFALSAHSYSQCLAISFVCLSSILPVNLFHHSSPKLLKSSGAYMSSHTLQLWAHIL